jgi:hypothetical protein
VTFGAETRGQMASRSLRHVPRAMGLTCGVVVVISLWLALDAWGMGVVLKIVVAWDAPVPPPVRRPPCTALQRATYIPSDRSLTSCRTLARQISPSE